ncbi:MAG TPA: SRPBCC domain-containing protein [Flavitalea sp.]|nr:SRPBCC domain-containing protein [Flavitalea sp.]
MKKLEFKININASAKKVWDTMLAPESYKKWVQVSWPDSHYVGQWRQGEDIKFVSSSGEGTLARLTEVSPHQVIAAEHIAVILKDGSHDSTSDVAKGWVGTTETYTFTEKDGKTEVKVEIITNPDWEKMFNDGWPNALKKLKQITEE